MASITTKERVSPKGVVFFQVQVRGRGVEKPYSKSFPTSEAAKEWADEQDQIVHGTAPPEPVTPVQSEFTIANLMQAYLTSTQYKGGKRKPGYVTIESRLNVLSRDFGDQDISTITEEDVNRYSVVRQSRKAKSRSHNVSGSTIRKELELLKRLLNWAKEKKGITVSVDIKGNMLPDEGEPRSKVFTPAEYESMLNGVAVNVHG